MFLYQITVKQIAPNAKLHYEDKRSNPKGIYHIRAGNEEEALDEFHETVPIACLDDFEITLERMKYARNKKN